MNDPRRPMQLLTIVLRPAIFALLKSCDLAWREMSKKRVHDVSDRLLFTNTFSSLKCCAPIDGRLAE